MRCWHSCLSGSGVLLKLVGEYAAVLVDMILRAESCLLQHHDATVQHVHRCMADYLKLAPYRAGGAGRGCHAANFVSTLEGTVADNSGVSDTVDDGDEADDDGEGEGDRGHDGDDDSEADDDNEYHEYDKGDAGDVEGYSDVEDD